MKWRKIKYILFHRSVLAGLALVAQVAVLFVMVNEFTAHFDYFYWFCIFVSFLATVWIVSDRSEPGYKIAWLVVILPFPVFGGILYLCWAATGSLSGPPEDEGHCGAQQRGAAGGFQGGQADPFG